MPTSTTGGPTHRQPSGGSPSGTAGMVRLGGQTVGIDPHLVSQLASTLDKVPGAAAQILNAITGVCNQAAQAQERATPATAPHSGANPFTPMAAIVKENAGALEAIADLHAISQQAPQVSNEIKARLRHFNACQQEVKHHVLAIARSLWFADEPPPDLAKIRDAIGYVDAVRNITRELSRITALPDQVPGRAILQHWEQLKLGATEVDAMLNGLTPDQLKWLNAAVRDDIRNQLGTFILSNASQATIARLRPYLTSLQLGQDNAIKPYSYWKKHKGFGRVSWQPADEPLFGPHGPDAYTDVDQRYTGDCTFLAALAAVAHKEPGFIESHIRLDPNGNYTVRLYRNGQPVDVTVTPDLPESRRYGTMGADTKHGDDWVAIYEKAWAQLNGGYGAISGGYPAAMLTAITGRPASARDWGTFNVFSASPGASFTTSAPSLSDIQRKLSHGHILVASIAASGDFVDSHDEKFPGTHQYWINRVYTDPATHQQMIEVVSPWGPDAKWRDGKPAAEYIHLTQAEFGKFFSELDDLPPGETPSA